MGLITLESSHTRQFLCAENGGGGPLVANRPVAREWEQFQLLQQGDGKVALQSHGGWFMCAEGGGGREVTVSRRAPSDWETFTQLVHPDGRVSFRAHSGQWVCVETGGIVVANRTTCDEWEKFTVRDVEGLEATSSAPSRNSYGLDLPVRCRFCSARIPVDATACESCGARA